MRRTAARTSGLTALLDALEQDLLSAPAAELRHAQCETGRAWDSACQEIRSLLEAVASDDGVTVAASPRTPAATGLHLH